MNNKPCPTCGCDAFYEVRSTGSSEPHLVCCYCGEITEYSDNYTTSNNSLQFDEVFPDDHEWCDQIRFCPFEITEEEFRQFKKELVHLTKKGLGGIL